MSAITEPAGSGNPPNDHNGCLFCGRKNLYSLRLSFQPDGQNGVCARFHPHEGLQGYAGILHGGSVAGVLDAAMTHCLFQNGVRAVTADLHVRYLKPVPCDGDLDVRAHIVSASPPLFRLKAELLRDGEALAWAEAKFLLKNTGEAE